MPQDFLVKSAVISFFSAAVLLASAMAEGRSAAEIYQLPKEAIEALSTGQDFVLYSLDPGPIFSMRPRPKLKPWENYNGFKMLGRLPLTDPRQRSIAVNAVADGIRRSDYHHIALRGTRCV